MLLKHQITVKNLQCCWQQILCVDEELQLMQKTLYDGACVNWSWSRPMIFSPYIIYFPHYQFGWSLVADWRIMSEEKKKRNQKLLEKLRLFASTSHDITLCGWLTFHDRGSIMNHSELFFSWNLPKWFSPHLHANESSRWIKKIKK